VANPYWPLFDLRVGTARLELRLPTDEDLHELAAIAARGIHPPEEMPFAWAFTDLPSPGLERGVLQFQWRCRAELGPERWDLVLAVRADGRLVGVQGVAARQFAVRREVHTGSWLGKDHQRQGIGTEMRAAVLHLAFAGLGAEVAVSAAFPDNPASERISRKLGYEPDGLERIARRGAPVDARRFRLTREAWEATHRPEVELAGVEPCLPLLGAGPKT
jgi:RimJ/RimL family protein N-acetyltransferase